MDKNNTEPIVNITKQYATTQEIIDGQECPLPLSVIPNHMGINLVSVEGIEWEKQEDGQLTNLRIFFIPYN